MEECINFANSPGWVGCEMGVGCSAVFQIAWIGESEVIMKFREGGCFGSGPFDVVWDIGFSVLKR